jgi:hypothetical protein
VYGEHLPDRVIEALAEGTANAVEREEAAEHLAVCSQCAGDVEDLVLARATLLQTTSRATPGRSRILAVAASLILVAVTSWLALRSPRTPPPSVVATGLRSRNVEDDVLRASIEAAMATGRIDPPEQWRRLQMGPIALRGDTAELAAARLLEPTRELVRELRPHLRWDGPPGAIFTASVYEGERLVTSSGRISASEWMVDGDLAPAHSYVWQLEVNVGGNRTIVPDPSLPVARFVILDDAARQRLERGERMAGADHLVRGILSAQAGLQRAAEHEFGAIDASSPQHAVAQRLLVSVREWKNVPDK